jgi:GNAT superfamily N-acetyltransferase
VSLEAPVPLDDGHSVDDFACGVAALDDWLKQRARRNEQSGASHTYVACLDDRVVGYYALAAGAVELATAPGRFRRNMPDPIPVVVLGRLAVDQRQHGKGLGRALFRDAGLRVLQAAAIIGVHGLLVEAISPEAKAFYLALGMSPSPLDPRVIQFTALPIEANRSLRVS